MSVAATPTHRFLHPGWIEEFRDRGYTILRGVFTAAEIAELKSAFDRAYEEGMRHHATWRHQNRLFWVNEHPDIGRFISGCQWQSWADPVLDRVRTDARMFAILQPLLGEDIKQIINQMHWKVPGSRHTWGLHQDVRSRTPAHCFRNLGTSYVQTGLGIDRHRAGNGAMKLLPFSHLRGNLMIDNGVARFDDTREEAVAQAGFDPARLIDCELDEGDLGVWGPYLIHGGGINSSMDSYRRLYINGYVRAADCDRGQPAFHHGKPVPLRIPALIQYEDLYVRPDPHYPCDRASLLQRD
jgi:ectoine hydroxylase-related dioxygenase (phytanoyl-CoA dioxygenase family)